MNINKGAKVGIMIEIIALVIMFLLALFNKTMATAYDGWVTEDKNRYVLRNKVMVCGFDDTKEFQRKKEGAIAAVFATDEITMRIPNGDGGA
ncbi:MAG: hypothetical protein PHR60_00935, partial [Eubacteriales bacterium]|nr:hypothetical protein [Eubacteriales bacterium]